MDIRIGAVFSLAETGSEETDTECDVTGIDDTMLENNEPNSTANQVEGETDEEGYFIANDGQRHPIPSDMSTISADVDQSMNVSTDSALSDVIDQDCPPSLSMETETQGSADCSWSEEDMLPPVLEPEKLNNGTYKSSVAVENAAVPDEDKYTTRGKCTKIFPSYLVLTNIRKTLKDADRISYRKFKRTFKECTNMCKKIYFRRRLEVGKDVFNVKSPSKQTSHIFTHHYMNKEKNGIDRVGTGDLISKRKMLDIQSHVRRRKKLKTKKGKDSGCKQMVSRVQRMIQYMPKDFQRSRTQIIDISSGKQTLLETEEKPKINHEKYLVQLRSRELANLRNQIRMKRHANKFAKKIRKVSMGVTSGTSFKVRKRKTNTRYGTEFALTHRSDELLQYVAMAKIEQRLQKERRRMKEDVNCLKRRMSGMDSRKKTVEPVIDNPEANRGVIKVSIKGTNVAVNRTDSKLKVKLKVDTKKMIGNNLKQKILKRSKAFCDGVLIRELPNENQVISGILDDRKADDNVKLSLPENQRTGLVDHKVADLNAYPYAKSLLKFSLIDRERDLINTVRKTVPVYHRVPVDQNRILSTPELEREKVQALRIPESVQNLFKVKSEPIDTGYEQAMNTTSPHITPPPHIVPHNNSYTSKYSTSVGNSTIPRVVSPQSGFKTLPSFPPAPMQVPLLKSPNKGALLPTVICQSGPSVPSNSLFMNAGGGPVPVTLKTGGPNGEKMVTVLLAMPSTTTPNTSITTSHNSLTNTTSRSYVHGATSDRQIGIHMLSPVPSQSNQDPHPVSKIPVGNSQQGVVIHASRAEPAANKSVLSDSQPSSAPRLVKIGPCQLSKQPDTKVTVSTGVHGRVLSLPQNDKITATPIAQTKPSLSGAASAPTTVLASQAAPVLPTLKTQVTNKSKFYLVKVDDKNILIPMNTSTSTPSTAFIVNSGSSVLHAIPTGPGGQAPTPTVLTFPVRSSMESTTKAVLEDKVLPKPTATLTPNIKYTSEIGRLSALKNSKMSPNFADIQSAMVLEETPNPFIKEDRGKTKPISSGKGKRRGFSKSDDNYETLANSPAEISHNDEITEKAGSKTETVDEKPETESNIDLKLRKGGSKNKREVTQVKDKAFTEAISDRDERLRKLKELLKEKQRAVEEIRASRLKAD